MEVVPRMNIAFFPLMVIPIFILIGLSIFLVTKFGKGKPGVVMLSIGGFIAAIFAFKFFIHAGALRGLPVGVGMIWLPMMIGGGVAISLLVKKGRQKEDSKDDSPVTYGEPKSRNSNGGLFAGLIVAGLVIVAIFAGGRHFRFGPGVPGVLELMIVMGVAVAIYLFVKSGRKKESSNGKKEASPVTYGVPEPRKSNGAWAGLLVVALVVGVVLAYFITVPVSHRQVSRPAEEIGHLTAVNSEHAIWHSGVEEQFRADVYPSRRAAVMALGRQVAETTIQASLADQQLSREIGVLADDHDQQLTGELAEQIKSYIHGDDVVCRVLQNDNNDEWEDESGNSTAQMKLWVRLAFEDVKTDPAKWSDKDVSSGKVTLTVKGPSGLSKSEVLFSEKPWIENFSEYLSRNPDRQLLLVRSSDSCTSSIQAHQQTLNDACRRITEILRGMQADPSILPTNFDVTENDISSAGLVIDRFTQRFSGMAGPIWRQALLVDTSASKLEELANKKINISSVKRETWGKMAITLLGMFALICLVYVFLNAATRGYYVWALRIAVAVLMVVGVFLVLTLS